VNPAFIQIENVKVTTTTAYSNQSDAIVAKLDLINNKLPNNFNSIEVTNDVGNPLPVNIVNGGTTGGASELTLTTLNNKVTSNGGRIQVETQPITVNAGDATAANQTTGNNTLSAINTKVPTNLTVTNNRLLVDTVFPTSFEISNDIGNSIPVTITGGSAVGGATETTLSALNAKLPAQINSRLPVDIEQLEIVNDANNRIFTDTIISNLPPGAATETTLAALNNKVIVTGGRIQVETQPITLSGGGDATAANQITGNNTLI
jgi:hypothetical protein